MKDISTEQLRAKSRLRLLEVILLSCLVIGSILEYQTLMTPLDSVMLIYQKKTGTTENTVSMPSAPVVEEKPQAQSSADAGKEFIGYLREIQADIDSIKEPAFALENIIQPQKKTAFEAPVPNTDKDTVVIYDDHDQPQQIIVTPTPKAPQISDSQPKAEKMAEDKPQTPEANSVKAVETNVNEKINAVPEQVEAIAEQDKPQIEENIDNHVENDEDAPINLISAIMQQKADENTPPEQ